ncbi:MAG: hypothetical protein IKY18_09570 [Oscillospiraceae bacterium]|nr:hypothetical protein [Oscillospiraceae bacterium]
MQKIKRKNKNKIFHDSRCRKLCFSKRNPRSKKKNPNYKAGKSNRLIVCAPRELCLFDSTDTTLNFFDDVIEKIKQCGPRYTLYFDLSQVEVITPDAVMYLIAIINNTKKVRVFEIACEGNMPKNQAARAVFQDVGFFKFVSAPYARKLNDSNGFMKIHNGTDADNILAGAFCEFVHNNCNKDYTSTKRLYPMIIELMTNTHQHAYHLPYELDGHLEMYSNWYIFAQDLGSAVHFVFLDTGSGIPSTVSRKLREKVSDILSVNNDAVYLESALKGDYSRSETKLAYRGKGLPGIYEDCKNNQICNLKIISCRAKCLVNNDGLITAQNMSSYFEGTLFSWDIAK